VAAIRRMTQDSALAVLEQMSPSLDSLSLNFAMASRGVRFHVLDVGCGDGIATAAALARGAHVVAIDPDADRLNALLAKIPSEHWQRLRLQLGELPGLDFKGARFSALHCARVLHRLGPAELRLSLRKFHRWLYPEGKLFLSAFSPAGDFWRGLRPEYLRRMVAQENWPGFLRDPSRFVPEAGETCLLHLLDESVLRRELREAGFVIEEIGNEPLPWNPEHMCCSVIARPGQS
jgi:ubiquinone/menaquinone biosynthesis C-methylase UbiE